MRLSTSSITYLSWLTHIASNHSAERGTFGWDVVKLEPQNLLGQTAINDMQQIAEVVKGAKMLLKNQVLPVGGPEVPWSHPLTGVGDGPHISSPTRQTHLSILTLLFLTCLTTLSAVVRTTPGTFLTFIMLVAVLSAAGVSYFQTPVFAVASIFGPRAVQAVMAGQAAVGVVVNMVHLGSATISLHQSSKPVVHSGRTRTPEEIAAFVSFAFTTCILCISLAAHRWLVRTPAYKLLIEPIEQRIVAANELEESQTLLSSSGLARTPNREEARERIVRVAKANVLYEIAVAYVFVVTLVCPFADLLHFMLTHRLHTIVCLPTYHISHSARQSLVSVASLQSHPRPPL
ncbi:hypothetical protein M378DRAFT_10965 [Amanita muscaria Koide BX008]|uniref:Uncharacterized protein n=1 Tax=Amanita muscaria (strain Koide BX008) TaxID=946122 RepID=A0A0C2X8J9_AMAMK|nr:hypothetical protein M378DRAFT_10965 [Amanita muscaria Koide BX008]